MVQWRGEIGVFYSKFQVFFNSSTCCSVAAPSYASISNNFCFTRLPTLIFITFFAENELSYHKKINDNVFMIKPYIRCVTYFLITWSLLKYIGYDSRIIILSDDIEKNPGPKHSFSNQVFKICHWNLNSLLWHMYKKVSLLSAFIFVHKLHIICLSQTYLNSETSPDDGNLEKPGYNIIRKDHPSNTKCGGVCVYYKSTLLFNIINIKYPQECITFKIRIGRKCCNFSCLYRSPRETNDDI